MENYFKIGQEIKNVIHSSLAAVILSYVPLECFMVKLFDRWTHEYDRAPHLTILGIFETRMGAVSSIVQHAEQKKLFEFNHKYLNHGHDVDDHIVIEEYEEELNSIKDEGDLKSFMSTYSILYDCDWWFEIVTQDILP